MKSKRGSRGCSDSRGRAAPRPAPDRVLGSAAAPRGAGGGGAAGTAQGWVSRARSSPRPQRGRAGGSAGRVGPDAAPRSAERADPQPPARRDPDSPASRRQNPGFAAAPGARPGPASRQEAAPRRHPFGPPRSAPPAHFPQEMINPGRGAFPWQPAPTRRGAAVRAGTRSRTLARARAHTHSHAGPPSARRPVLRPDRPPAPGSSRPARAGAHVRDLPRAHTHARTFMHGRTHQCTRPRTRSRWYTPTASLLPTYIPLHRNLLSSTRTLRPEYEA